MIALEHRRDTGVLRAMGAGPGTIFRVALTQGLLLGVSGCAAGTLFASAAIFLVNRVIPFRLEDSVYWVDTLVARIDPGTWVVIAGGTLAACLAASLVPAAGAVAVPPAECVRHE